MTLVAVSGGFDPLHAGHLSYFREARKLGDKLVVILNNDNWLINKKGYVFMKEDERAKIMKALKWVDDVYITKHKLNDPDTSICHALREVKPDIFAKGGDSKGRREAPVIAELGIEVVTNVGAPKKEGWSSSDLVEQARKAREKVAGTDKGIEGHRIRSEGERKRALEKAEQLRKEKTTSS